MHAQHQRCALFRTVHAMPPRPCVRYQRTTYSVTEIEDRDLVYSSVNEYY